MRFARLRRVSALTLLSLPVCMVLARSVTAQWYDSSVLPTDDINEAVRWSDVSVEIVLEDWHGLYGTPRPFADQELAIAQQATGHVNGTAGQQSYPINIAVRVERAHNLEEPPAGTLSGDNWIYFQETDADGWHDPDLAMYRAITTVFVDRPDPANPPVFDYVLIGINDLHYCVESLRCVGGPSLCFSGPTLDALIAHELVHFVGLAHCDLDCGELCHTGAECWSTRQCEFATGLTTWAWMIQLYPEATPRAHSWIQIEQVDGERCDVRLSTPEGGDAWVLELDICCASGECRTVQIGKNQTVNVIRDSRMACRCTSGHTYKLRGRHNGGMWSELDYLSTMQ